MDGVDSGSAAHTSTGSCSISSATPAVRAWQPKASEGTSGRRTHSQPPSLRKLERLHDQRRVDNIVASLHAPAGQPSAAQRLEALRSRIVVRSMGG